jgi:uncharacterized protein
VHVARTLELLVMQPPPFCNISCDYCYLAHRSDTRRMPLEIVETAFRAVRASGLLSGALSVVWHAGEPLTAGPTFYRDSFRIANEVLGKHADVSHCLQTNGILINDRWCELFAEWRVNVGVSLDGPAPLHDRHRTTRDGRPTHARVMKGIDCLRRHGLPFHVIAVVTRDSLPHADAIMQFFIDNEITQIGFNIDEAEGATPQTSMRGMEARYVEFMQKAKQAARAAPLPVNVRELTQAERAIRRDMPLVCVDGDLMPANSQAIPGAILSVDHAGNVTTWSPELIDLQHPRYGDFLLGNVMRDSVRTMLSSDKARAIQRDILSGIRACERSCGFFAQCGGGAPVNKLTENGSLASTETIYCRCSIQAPIRAVLEDLERELGIAVN